MQRSDIKALPPFQTGQSRAVHSHRTRVNLFGTALAKGCRAIGPCNVISQRPLQWARASQLKLSGGRVDTWCGKCPLQDRKSETRRFIASLLKSHVTEELVTHILRYKGQEHSQNCDNCDVLFTNLLGHLQQFISFRLPHASHQLFKVGY